MKKNFKSLMMCKFLALRAGEFYLKRVVYVQGKVTDQMLGEV